MLSVCRSFGGPLLLSVSELGFLALMRILQTVKQGRQKETLPVIGRSLSKQFVPAPYTELYYFEDCNFMSQDLIDSLF